MKRDVHSASPSNGLRRDPSPTNFHPGIAQEQRAPFGPVRSVVQFHLPGLSHDRGLSRSPRYRADSLDLPAPDHT